MNSPYTTEGLPNRKGPLDGLVVLDLGQIYQGPYCGFLLAMAGATVIKIEPPGGEPIRQRRESALPLAMLNSNKLGVTLDLKSKSGCARFLELVDRADVVLENFMPGVMDRLGIGSTVLCDRNPRLVYASASGYGSHGQDADLLAMDLTIQARSGAMHVTGYPDKPPVKAGPAVSDFLGGTHLYGAIVSALYDRERTGQGRVVEIAMQDAIYPALASNLQLYLENPEGQPRVGNRHGALAMAPYNTYSTKDGFVAIICVTDAHWGQLCLGMQRQELAQDPAYATHEARCRIIDRTDSLVESWTQSFTRAQVVAIAREYRFPCAEVRTLGEVVNDQHMHERGMLQNVQHPVLGEVTLPASPLRFSGMPSPRVQPNPGLGEHNESILEILDRRRLYLTD